MHLAANQFIGRVKKKFPQYFIDSYVLDVGSLDINGSNRQHFSGGTYTGLDITPGRGVDVVCPVHEWETAQRFDVVISTEMLEHDRHWYDSIRRMYELVKPKGILILTAATTGRMEHGTRRSDPKSSPATLDWYRNITFSMMHRAFEGKDFVANQFSFDWGHKDIYFYGIKK